MSIQNLAQLRWSIICQKVVLTWRSYQPQASIDKIISFCLGNQATYIYMMIIWLKGIYCKASLSPVLHCQRKWLWSYHWQIQTSQQQNSSPTIPIFLVLKMRWWNCETVLLLYHFYYFDNLILLYNSIEFIFFPFLVTVLQSAGKELSTTCSHWNKSQRWD